MTTFSFSSPGTVLLTGANGSAGFHAAEHLLKTYPSYTAIFTVRDASPSDPNTQRLRDMITLYPSSQVQIHQVDLSSLPSVHEFATLISDSVSSGRIPPLQSIICNAFYWNLVSPSPEPCPGGGYDKTMQVTFISHVALILRLVDRFLVSSPSSSSGRIVLISSDAHYTDKKAPLSKYLPGIPQEDLLLDELVYPPSPREGDSGDRQSRGFQRYANAKLATTMWMFPLLRHLRATPSLPPISVVATNPGGLADSRCFSSPQTTPLMVRILMGYVLAPLNPLMRKVLVGSNLRTSAEAGREMVDIAVNVAIPGGESGYFTLTRRDKADGVAEGDEGLQERLWRRSAVWAGLVDGDDGEDGKGKKKMGESVLV